MSQQILTALKALDVANDNHWTADGLPRLDTVKMLAANPTLSREAVEAAAPGFNRATAADYTVPAVGSAGSAVAAVGVGEGAAATATPAAVAVTPPAGEEGGAPFSNEQAQQPEVAATGPATNEVETLAAQLEEVRREIDGTRTALDEGDKFLKELVKKENELADKLMKVSPPDDNASAIRAYLDAQVAKGAERAARKKLILESGLDMKELARDLKSPLDAAMARKTGRGGQRPAIPKA
jgi:hypothetical protein